jgi:hypothetical protein
LLDHESTVSSLESLEVVSANLKQEGVSSLGCGCGDSDHDSSVVAVDVLVIEPFGVVALPD